MISYKSISCLLLPYAYFPFISLIFHQLAPKMSKIHPSLLPCFVLILMIVSTLAQDLPPLGSILPKIDQESFKLIPQGDGYTLRIELPDGSTRDENVELKNPGTPEQYLSVTGSSNIYFPGALFTTTYTADKKGYVVHYDYNRIYFISPGALKASAG